MRDKLEKYVAMPEVFPNKAGEVKKQLETLKRLMQKVMRGKQSEDVQQLLLAGVNLGEAADDLLSYTQLFMQGVADDAKMLADGAQARNTIKMQSDEIRRCWELLEKAGLK